MAGKRKSLSLATLEYRWGDVIPWASFWEECKLVCKGRYLAGIQNAATFTEQGPKTAAQIRRKFGIKKKEAQHG